MITKKVLGVFVGVLIAFTLVTNLDAQPVSLFGPETFEATWIPSGWSVGINSGIQGWRRNDYFGYPGNLTQGANGYCACNNDDYWGSARTVWNWLQSPTFNATGYTNVGLAFDIYYNMRYTGTEHGYLQAWDGAQWVTQLVGFFSDTMYFNSLNMRDTVDLSAACANKANMRIRFVYDESPSAGWGFYWEIDDLRIWGWNPPPPDTSDTLGADLEIVMINRPFPEEEGGVAFKPACKIFNPKAEDTVEALVTCKIKDNGTMQYIYEDELHGFILPPGYTDCSAFKFFTPDDNKSYYVIFTLENDEDTNTSNNSKDMDFTTPQGINVTPDLVIAPTDEPHKPFKPQAEFKEMLSLPAPGVLLYCMIDDTATYLNVLGPFDFAADETRGSDLFPDAAGLSDGQHTIYFWAMAGKDTISEPVLTKTFTYTAIAEEPDVSGFNLEVSARTVNFTLDKASSVNLAVYDVAGNLVTTLASGSYNAGPHSVTWNADASTGLYFVKLTTPEHSTVRKLTLLH